MRGYHKTIRPACKTISVNAATVYGSIQVALAV